jgi:hypothetical protein
MDVLSYIDHCNLFVCDVKYVYECLNTADTRSRTQFEPF